MTTMIKCKDLSFAYENKTVISGLNFEICEGDYLCVVGENGAGKSTLMKGMLGLKEPSGGSIERAPSLKPTQIGYLPQQTAAQMDFPASVYEVVLSGRLNKRGFKPFYNREDKINAMDNMARLGISNIAKRCYRELSGGQQQRVLLARALCATEKMLLLDEPVSGLDPVATAELYSTISLINKSMGITVIMISHDIKTAVEHAGKILYIGGGDMFFGTKNEYVRSEYGRRFLKGDCNG